MTMGVAAKTIVTALLTVILGGPAFASAGMAAETRPAVVEPVTSTAPARKVTAEDASRYAARETAAPGLERYRGGSYVYIGGSAIAVALLIVLLVVLL
jgi:hypothetical protein